MPADLSIVIVTYECRQLVLDCLASLGKSDSARAIEVVAVDNGSGDGTADAVREAHSDIKVIEMGWNSGFSTANNRGIEASSGELVLLLNPDTEVRPSALEEMASFLEGNTGAGAAGPRLVYPDGTDQGTARAFPTPAAAVFGRRSPLTRIFPRNRWSRRYLSGLQEEHVEPFQVDWVSGACLMVKRSVLDEVGSLDEDFFMHWEDAEWCHRIKDAGYTVWSIPAAVVVHHEGGVRRGWPASQVWHFHKGAYLYWSKAGAGRRLWFLRPVAYGALMARAGLVIAKNSIAALVRRGKDSRAMGERA